MTRWLTPSGLFTATLLLAGCGTDVQSALSPRGVQAGQIALLSWILFAFALAVLTIVMAALWFAIRGPARTRAALAGENAVLGFGLIFPAVTLTVLLGYGVWLMRAQLGLDDKRDTMRIEVTGEQWWWRIAYTGAGGSKFASANEIRIPVGQPVEFTLKSADVIHSFWVPSLGGKMDMTPGRDTKLRLEAERPGIYRGQCAEYCGGPHALMAFEVIAMPDADYQAWLAREAAPVQAATGDSQRGETIFNAAGCGTCHTVRGTQAAGTIGPDLTHVGGRRSIGAETLPLNADNLVRFIVSGQHVKPGNLMPEFRIFQPDEQQALAGYLLSLR